MRILFLFLDGVGLGNDNPEYNPLAGSYLPVIQKLLNGARLVKGNAPIDSARATFLALDPCLGIPGLPQSASGQATLLTGENIPAILGEHYGPKPNPPIAQLLSNGNLFSTIKKAGKEVAFLNAFPQGYFRAIESGKRLPGAIAMAALHAGVALKTKEDLYHGNALSADFTGEGWRNYLGYPDAPILDPITAGHQLSMLAQTVDFSIFEYWPTDLVGHRQDMDGAREILTILNGVLTGLLEKWVDEEGLIFITSDHGNLEALDTRRHTDNPVPCLLIGNHEIRHQFAQNLHDLTGIYPAVLRIMAYK